MQTTTIQDFGQKIGGAKKDLARKAIDQLNLVTNEVLALQPLSKSFPRPDFARMFRDGIINAEYAVKLQYLYDTIPTKPRNSTTRIKRWVEKVMPVIGLIRSGLENPSLLTDQPIFTKLEFVNFQNEMQAANWPLENYNPHPFRIIHPYAYSSDKRIIVAKGNRIEFRSYNLQDCVDWIKNNAGTAKKTAKLQCAFWHNHQTNVFYITPKNKSGIVLKEFTTKEEAFSFYRNHLDELEAIYKKLRTIPNERRDWNRPRVGTNHRNGLDITPEQFSSIFPFRGVEFGNWVTQLERAACLNEAYDALFDLAGILGVSAETITLNNQLALAFGARGSGKALAHYEPLKRVINLTKKKGAGSLAHEWFHALDNHLCIQFGQRLLFATENPLIISDEKLSLAIKQLRYAIQDSPFYNRSEKIDDYKNKKYWALMIELSARAFEVYIIHKLAERGYANDYLANIVTFGEYARADIYPYPTNEENKRLVPYFDQFLDAAFNVELPLKQTA